MSDMLITSETPILQAQSLSQPESRVFRWFSRIAPHNQINADNPARSHELRDDGSLWRLYQQSLYWTLLPALFILVFYGAIALAIIIEGKPQPYYLPHLYHTVEGWLPWLFGVSFAGFIVMDFVGMMHTMDSLKADLENSNWDLIAVSDVDSTRFLRGKYASAQLRPWKYMCVVLGLRIALVIIGISHALIRQLMMNTPSELWDNLFSNAFNVPAVIALVILSIVLIAFYLIEPVWRLRMLVASGVLGVARKPHYTMRVFFAGNQLFSVWVRHLGFVFILLVVPLMAFVPASNSLAIINDAHLPIVYLFVLGGSMSLALWMFYLNYAKSIDTLLMTGARLMVVRGGGMTLPRTLIRRSFKIGLLIPPILWIYGLFWIWFENQLTLPPLHQLPLYYRFDSLESLFTLLTNVFSIGVFVSGLSAWILITLLASVHIRQPKIDPLLQRLAQIGIRNSFPFALSARIAIVLIFSLHKMLEKGFPSLVNTPLGFIVGLVLLIALAFYLLKEPLWRASVYYAILKPIEDKKLHWSVTVIVGVILFAITAGVEVLIIHTAVYWFGQVAWDIMLNPVTQLGDYGLELLRLGGLLIGVIGGYRLIIAGVRRLTKNETLRIGNDLLFNNVIYSDDSYAKDY